MIRITRSSLLAAMLFLAAGRASSGAEVKEGTDYTEVYNLIRANAAGISEAELNRAAVHGLVDALSPKVFLVTNGAPANAQAGMPLIGKTTLFENEILYLRIAAVSEGLAEELAKVYRQWNSTNKLKGIVLDLRYSNGMDYAAAAATADLFAAKAQPLLNWGNGVVSSREKSNAIQVPVALLVNKGTTSAAEALASALRETGSGLVLGSRTAGRAMVTKNFPLKNGGELRIATAAVALGDGSAISTDGIKPDIDVAVTPEDERAYYADAFYVVRKTNLIASASGSLTNQAGTNGSRRTRLNEAELVREHREGGGDRDPGEARRPRPVESEAPMVNDPVLARALDLLKGLAVVRQGRF